MEGNLKITLSRFQFTAVLSHNDFSTKTTVILSLNDFYN